MCTFSKQIHSFINAKHKKQIWKYSDLCRWIYVCKFRLSRDVNVNIFRHNFSIDFSLGGVTFTGENKFQFGSICLFCQSALPHQSRLFTEGKHAWNWKSRIDKDLKFQTYYLIWLQKDTVVSQICQLYKWATLGKFQSIQ